MLAWCERSTEKCCLTEIGEGKNTDSHFLSEPVGPFSPAMGRLSSQPLAVYLPSVTRGKTRKKSHRLSVRSPLAGGRRSINRKALIFESTFFQGNLNLVQVQAAILSSLFIHSRDVWRGAPPPVSGGVGEGVVTRQHSSPGLLEWISALSRPYLRLIWCGRLRNRLGVLTEIRDLSEEDLRYSSVGAIIFFSFTTTRNEGEALGRLGKILSEYIFLLFRFVSW
jgi:hypothetical protein